jgi:hypothetical protein
MSKGDRRRPTSAKFGNNFDEIDWSKGKDDKSSGKSNSGKPAGDKTEAKGGDRK